MGNLFSSLKMLFYGHTNEIYGSGSSTELRISRGFSCKILSAPGCALIVCLVMALLPYSPVLAGEAEASGEKDEFKDFAILTTSDMHGKCWDTNVLTESSEKSNMLHVSTAVSEIRKEYGEENVLLIDNGDLFQGDPVSEVQLIDRITGDSEDPPAMALCLKEIGYDIFVPGNHEYNYDWDTMEKIYQYVEENKISVIAANICYDGSDPVHTAGENVFTPYTVKTIRINGHEHKIGILGLGSTDITRWDLPVNYPGQIFVHPENDSYSLSYEAGLYIPRMREEGCEFIIVSYHGAIGDNDKPLEFGTNSQEQGKRIISETEGIDMLVLGHDHFTSYSNTFLTDAAGRQVLTVNAGSKDLTRSVFRFSEDDKGGLRWTLLRSDNLNLSEYETDRALEAKISPYAAKAEEFVNLPVGTLTGKWDLSNELHTRQTDTMDLVHAALIETCSKFVKEKYGDIIPEDLACMKDLDHLDVDMSISGVSTNGRYVASPGAISGKEIYSLYCYNNTACILSLYGREIREILEENAAQRLKARVMKGNYYVYNINDMYTNLLCGGLNFTYDLSKPEGSRVLIEDFSNGREFEEDKRYLVAVNNYILGNMNCGLRDFTTDDTVWSQSIEASGETIQNLLTEYIQEKTEKEGGVSPDLFTWHWEITYSEDPTKLAPYEGKTAAVLTDRPEDGHTYVLYSEANGGVLTGKVTNEKPEMLEVEAYGDYLVGELPPETLLLTAHLDEEGRLSLSDAQGRYLTVAADKKLMLTAEPSVDKGSEDGGPENKGSEDEGLEDEGLEDGGPENKGSEDEGLENEGSENEGSENETALWRLEETRGGWFLHCDNDSGNPDNALECFRGFFQIYQWQNTGDYIFNFYEVQ